jgi:hypothetical protein
VPRPRGKADAIFSTSSESPYPARSGARAIKDPFCLADRAAVRRRLPLTAPATFRLLIRQDSSERGLRSARLEDGGASPPHRGILMARTKTRAHFFNGSVRKVCLIRQDSNGAGIITSTFPSQKCRFNAPQPLRSCRNSSSAIARTRLVRAVYVPFPLPFDPAPLQIRFAGKSLRRLWCIFRCRSRARRRRFGNLCSSGDRTV